MTTQNSTNFNSADFDIDTGVFELDDAVIKSVSADTDSATPSSHVLTMTGSGGLSTSGAGNTVTVDGSGLNGKLILITSSTASGDASICFTDLSSSYFMYVVVLDMVICATDTDNLCLRTSTDNGSSYDSGSSDYTYNAVTIDYNENVAIAGDADDSEIELIRSCGTGSNEFCTGLVYLMNPSGTTYTNIMWEFYCRKSDAIPYYIKGRGARLSAADVDAVQFFMSSGNISSGTFKLYGVKAS